jgi:glyoxylase-like metal-dependent hydrolase (beta-lactamase superfamily II)
MKQSIEEVGAQPLPYEVFAVKYATREALRRNHFIGGDSHDGPMAMDYYVWVVRNAERTVVVDTGFSAEMATKRGRTLLRTPAEGLKLLGIDAASVKDVIITHLHYDHVGTFESFPQAQFHLQDDEMSYATGRHMCQKQFSHSYEVDEIVGMVRLVYKNRVSFYSGKGDLAPGLTVHRIGGHTHGMQCVRVWTKRGWMVLASDTSHYYEHFEKRRAYTTMFNVGEALQGYAKLEALADSTRHIIPGHDPLVMQRYPAASQEMAGIVARLDMEPNYG